MNKSTEEQPGGGGWCRGPASPSAAGPFRVGEFGMFGEEGDVDRDWRSFSTLVGVAPG